MTGCHHHLLLSLDFFVVFALRDAGTLPILGSPTITNSNAAQCSFFKVWSVTGRTATLLFSSPGAGIDLTGNHYCNIRDAGGWLLLFTLLIAQLLGDFLEKPGFEFSQHTVHNAGNGGGIRGRFFWSAFFE
jgi:hypothetical protein